MTAPSTDSARVVVVTGGGTGIGRAVAARFAADGDRVVVAGRREEPLREAAEALGPTVTAVRADVSRLADVQGLAEEVRSAFGRVDVLVNNAGYLLGVTLADLEAGAAAFEEVVGANLTSTYLVTAALSELLTKPGGRVVNISSIAACTGGSGTGAAQAYAAAKAGVLGLTFGMARELGPQGVTVNAIAPGFVADTGFTESFPPARVRWLVDQTMVGRGGHVDDVVAAVRHLASPEASYVCGQVLHVNGGALFGR
jgi:3-oxoacyl-[acyl-carrier protein] reductase